MKTNAESRFKEGVDLTSDGRMFKELEVVEHDLKPLIELEVTMFDIPFEIFYRINDDNYIQLLVYNDEEIPKIFAQYKLTYASIRENFKAILQKYVEFSTMFNGQPRFLKSGFLTEFDYKQIINDIEEKQIKNELDARKKETPLINYISSLDLELMPKGDGPYNWISKCPNGKKHFLMISTLSDEWGCGYCKKKGKLNDLKKWVAELEGKTVENKTIEVEKFNPIIIKTIIILLFIFLTYLSAKAEYGDSLACYQGVTVYDGFDSMVYDPDYKYDTKWQCTEYAVRFFDVVHHRDYSSRYYKRAKQLYDKEVSDGGDWGYGIVQYSRWSVFEFKEGQAVIFKGGRTGHVAIISEVTDTAVWFVGENQYPVYMYAKIWKSEGMWSLMDRTYLGRLDSGPKITPPKHDYVRVTYYPRWLGQFLFLIHRIRFKLMTL